MTSCTVYSRISHIWLISPFICPFFFLYEVYRGYIVFAFSVRMFVCVSVNFFFCQRFLRNYLTWDLKILYKHQVLQVVLCIQESATYGLSVPLFVHFSFSLTKFSVTNFSASISDRVFKFCIHDEDNQMYY